MQRQNIDDLSRYYEDGADDYYANEGSACSWQGKGAKYLGLSGHVESDKVKELLAGNVDGENTRSFIRHDSRQRIGIDLTFSAPKSVSIHALVGEKVELIKAHDRAVEKAIERAESLAQARFKIKGKTRVENTGNLIVAKFRHETSREQDPHLHTHAVVMNLTKRSDGKWRALRNDEIIKATRYLGMAYRSELAKELDAMGYEIRHGRDGLFELAGIDRKQLEGFSQRALQVEERLKEGGLTRESATADQKQHATLETRAKKTILEREVLFESWKNKAEGLGICFDKKHVSRDYVKEAAISKSIDIEKQMAERAVRFAIKHLTERQSVMNESAIIKTGLVHAIGQTQVSDIEKAMKGLIEDGYLIREETRYIAVSQKDGISQVRSDWVDTLIKEGCTRSDAKRFVKAGIEKGALVPLSPRYTTTTALIREKSILKMEKEGRGLVNPIMEQEDVISHLSQTGLNKDQQEAARILLSSSNRITGIQGFAGVGKSYLLETVKGLTEKEGYQFKALAPYGSQVKALRELGVESNTLASFLKARDKNINEKTILIIDEAGVVPTRQMEQALRLADRAGARVVLLGDIQQTKAIEAGKPFAQLQEAGMETSRIEIIQRQKNETLKEAVLLAAKGNTAQSLERLTSVQEIKNDQKRWKVISKDYLKLPEDQQEKTLIVSGTNEARRTINKHVREGLGLSGKGITLDILIRRDTTQSERQHARYYRVGDVISPEKDYKGAGLERGALYRVEESGLGKHLTVTDKEGKQIKFNPMVYSRLSVYRPEKAEISIGEKVRINRNEAKLDLANGDRFTVKAVDQKQVTLTDGKREVQLSTEKPLHMEHSYATTIHSSQGLTSERVFIDKPTSKDLYYVGISRAKTDARIYTDDRKELPKNISRESIKFTALDINRSKNHKEKEFEQTTLKGNK